MATLIIPSSQTTLTDTATIQDFLAERGITFARWEMGEASQPIPAHATQDEILAAYAPTLDPFMAERGYQSADVIQVDESTENLQAIRDKFLKEHTHSEDEVRFFIEGQGYFWFNLTDDKADIFCVRCEAGDLLGVPAGVKHWFDLGPFAHVKAIRLFTNADGWIAQYTELGTDSWFSLDTVLGLIPPTHLDSPAGVR